MLSNAKHPAMRDGCKTALRHDLYDLGTGPSAAPQDDTVRLYGVHGRHCHAEQREASSYAVAIGAGPDPSFHSG
jgi:hypothetical protein